jgi:hypothetical protein
MSTSTISSGTVIEKEMKTIFFFLVFGLIWDLSSFCGRESVHFWRASLDVVRINPRRAFDKSAALLFYFVLCVQKGHRR